MSGSIADRLQAEFDALNSQIAELTRERDDLKQKVEFLKKKLRVAGVWAEEVRVAADQATRLGGIALASTMIGLDFDEPASPE